MNVKRIVQSCMVVLVALMASRLIAGTPVRAHGSGPPYVKINGDYALSNPILNIAQPTKFTVGADVASASGYLIGKPIAFSIDEQFFPNPYLQAQNPFGLPVTNAPDVPKALFRWDFKDGSALTEGTSVTHIFTKPGTYVVDLQVKFAGKTEEYSTVNTIQMDVLPTQSYTRPQARIRVNDTTIENQERDTADIKPAVPVSFDASNSVGSVVKYEWDFGDGKGSQEKVTTHRYSRDEYFPVAVLRVTDENNIAADTYALLNMPFERPNIILKIWYAISDFVTGIFTKSQ